MGGFCALLLCPRLVLTYAFGANDCIRFLAEPRFRSLLTSLTLLLTLLAASTILPSYTMLHFCILLTRLALLTYLPYLPHLAYLTYEDISSLPCRGLLALATGNDSEET